MGGHYDTTTGTYHYHHGYPAHQHTNGICPYDYDSLQNQSERYTIEDTEYDEGIGDIIGMIIVIAIAGIICVFIITKSIKAYKSEKADYLGLSTRLQIEYNNMEEELQSRYTALQERCLQQQTDLNEKLYAKYQHMQNTYMKEKEQQLVQAEELLKSIVTEEKVSHPSMAKVLSDYEWYLTHQAAEYLRHKKHPAIKAAETVEFFENRNAELIRRLKEAEYSLSYYEGLYNNNNYHQLDIDEIK